jgi:hypothetical protein
MNRHEFLSALHQQLDPRNYLEIGVNDGRSLALSRVRSIGVDPHYRIRVKLQCDAQLVKATSDAFFARPDPLAHLRGDGSSGGAVGRLGRRLATRLRPRSEGELIQPTLDLAFIDGMHWFEFALRDFMNIERHSSPTGVIVFDDVLPRSIEEAARDRTTKFWAGDVYKVASVLRSRRPDLVVVAVDSHPTGLLVVLNPDPSSTTLAEAYAGIVAAEVVPDPQAVPARVLGRADAVDPEAFLASDVCDSIVRARQLDRPDPELAERLRRTVGTLATGRPPRAGTSQPTPDPIPGMQAAGPRAG